MAKNKNNYSAWSFNSTTCVNVDTPFSSNTPQAKKEKNLVYGLSSLAEFLHQSITSAWRVKKNPKYKAAFMQKGRCIITDIDKLMELMSLENEVSPVDYTNYPNSNY